MNTNTRSLLYSAYHNAKLFSNSNKAIKYTIVFAKIFLASALVTTSAAALGTGVAVMIY